MGVCLIRVEGAPVDLFDTESPAIAVLLNHFDSMPLQRLGHLHVSILCSSTKRTCDILILQPNVGPLLAQPPDHYLVNRHTCGVQLKLCAFTFEGQFSGIPPNSARIESPNATMSLSKPVVDDIRHKEWYRREVMHAAFEAPVCRPKHERADSILRRSQ